MTQSTQVDDGEEEIIDLWFYYDASGTPYALKYQDEYFYYTTNAQGDVTAILNSSGNTVAIYSYDAWGNPLATTGTHALANLNPLRYRGYVYDFETELYYLQSRYYNPEVGRFLNADALVSTGQGIIGNNMFTYCGNNAVTFVDPSGKYYTPGQIHDFVIEKICSEDGNKKGKGTYMKYKTVVKKNNKRGYSTYGFCDIYDTSTNEIWEVKRLGGGVTCTLAAATSQLYNYIHNGVFQYYNDAGEELYMGGTKTTIEANMFTVPDNDGQGGYVIAYWDAGEGIVFYDYFYVPSPSEFAVYATAIGLGIGFASVLFTGGAGAGVLILIAAAIG